MIKISLSILSLLLFGCSATNVLNTSASNIIIYNKIENKDKCTYLGEIIASEGALHNYLFISNIELMNGARNALRNKAYALGGDSVEIENNTVRFSTSTLFVGNVYRCNQ